MKPIFYLTLLAGFAALGAANLAGADVILQTPTPTQVVDPHPYQSQVTLRLIATGIDSGAVQVLPPVTVKEYKYHVPGSPDLKSEFNTALLYDKRNPLPDTTGAGGNYTFYKDGFLTAVTADGAFYYYGKTNFKPATLGGVYFTDAVTNHIVLVDSYGYFWDSMTPAPAIRVVGGNYFIGQDGNLTTFKSMGTAPGNGVGMMTQYTLAQFSNVSAAGGNFFVNGDGSVTTVSSETGQYSYSPYFPSAALKIIGGNYFVGTDNYLYTVDSKGILNRNSDYPVPHSPMIKGYSFMEFSDGTFLFVDGEGIPHKSVMHVSSTGLSAKPEGKLSPQIDALSIFLPKIIY